jgi:hypothetical protein
MPDTTQHGFDAQRFAALWAGCDAGCNNEAEAVAKWRSLRRMVLGEGLRIVDVIFCADVLAALDDQLQPKREKAGSEGPGAEDALQEIERLRDALAGEREITAQLREQLARSAPARSGVMPARAFDPGLVNYGLVALVVGLAVASMIAAACRSFAP